MITPFRWLRRPLGKFLELLRIKHQVKDILREREMALKNRNDLKKWRDEGSPSPPPDVIKRGHLLATGKEHQLNVLIETGTFYGGTMFAMRNSFRELHSIELSKDIHDYVSGQLAHHPHIKLHHGDSTHILPDILKNIDQPCLFWLDGHYMGEGTGLGNKETPVLEELRSIATSPVSGHVILVDDARLFNGTHDYPNQQEFENFVKKVIPNASLHLKDDIFFINTK